MFIKKIIKGNKEDKQYTYYRLCESVRIGTKTRHHNLLNLGTLESFDPNEQKLLANRIEALYTSASELFAEVVPEKVESLATLYYRQLRNKKKSAKKVSSINPDNTPNAANELPTGVKDMEQIANSGKSLPAFRDESLPHIPDETLPVATGLQHLRCV